MSDPRTPSGKPLLHPELEPTEVPSEAPEYTLPELAKLCGEKAADSPDSGGYFWRHRVAATVHGWDRYEYNQATQIKMTRAVYEAALKAVEKDQVYTPAVRN